MKNYENVSLLMLLPMAGRSARLADSQSSQTESKTPQAAGASVSSQVLNQPAASSDNSGGQKRAEPKVEGTGPAASDASYRPGSGTIVLAELTKSLDARKARVNDQIECIVLQDLLYKGKIVVPHNSKVLGHVTEVKAWSKEEPQSRIGLVFGKIVLRDKKELPFQHPAVIEALASPMRQRSTPTTRVDQMPIIMTKGRTTGGAVIDAVGANSSLAGANMPSTTTGAISGANRGVIGIKDLSLETTGPEASVIVSNKGDEKLVFDTQLVLRVTDPIK